MKFYSSSIDTARSANEHVDSPLKTPLSGRKRAQNRSQLPNCQKFHDEQVLLWIQQKDAAKRVENRKKRAEERARREAEFAADMERKRRAEMASIAYNNWLLQKARDAETKRRSAAKLLERPATEQGMLTSTREYDIVSCNSLKSDKLEQLHGKSVANGIGANGSGENQGVIWMKQCTRAWSMIAENGEPFICSETGMSRNGEGMHDCKSKSVGKTNEKTVKTGTVNKQSIVRPQEVTISSEKSFMEPMVRTNELRHHGIQSTNQTHMNKLRQKYFEAEIERQARLEARKRLAFMEELDPKLIQTWTDFFKSRCLQLGEQESQLLGEKDVDCTTRNSSTKRPMEQMRRTHTSLSETDVSTKRSLMSSRDKSQSSRRRFMLKLPNATIFAAEDQRPCTSFECIDHFKVPLHG